MCSQYGPGTCCYACTMVVQITVLQDLFELAPNEMEMDHSWIDVVLISFPWRIPWHPISLCTSKARPFTHCQVRWLW